MTPPRVRPHVYAFAVQLSALVTTSSLSLPTSLHVLSQTIVTLLPRPTSRSARRRFRRRRFTGHRLRPSQHARGPREDAAAACGPPAPDASTTTAPRSSTNKDRAS